MRLAEIDLSAAVILAPDDTIADVAREMEDNGLSAVVICDGGVLVGIITERDVVRAAADGARLTDTALDEYMTAAPVTISERADDGDALRIMLDGEFRHIPVLSEDGDIVSVVTLRDVVKAGMSANR
jgi:CBS domain-containing protein